MTLISPITQRPPYSHPGFVQRRAPFVLGETSSISGDLTSRAVQLPFGVQLFWPRDGAEWTAWATVGLVLVTFLFVLETRRSTRELGRARFAEILPMLRWQQPEAYVLGVVRVLLTNEGPGPARLLDARVESNRSTDVWSLRDIAIPSTLPSNERLSLTARTVGSPVDIV